MPPREVRAHAITSSIGRARTLGPSPPFRFFSARMSSTNIVAPSSASSARMRSTRLGSRRPTMASSALLAFTQGKHPTRSAPSR